MGVGRMHLVLSFQMSEIIVLRICFQEQYLTTNRCSHMVVFFWGGGRCWVLSEIILHMCKDFGLEPGRHMLLGC